MENEIELNIKGDACTVVELLKRMTTTPADAATDLPVMNAKPDPSYRAEQRLDGLREAGTGDGRTVILSVNYRDGSTCTRPFDIIWRRGDGPPRNHTDKRNSSDAAL
jgi:hypothetical protein